MATRLRNTPLIYPEDLAPSHPDLQVEGVLNPAAFYFNNATYLLARVAEGLKDKKNTNGIRVPMRQNGELFITEISYAQLPTDWESDPRIWTDTLGKTYLTTVSHLRLFMSLNGVDFEDTQIQLHGIGPYETYGIEDPRVTLIGNTYYIVYTAASSRGVNLGMRTTQDWQSFSEPDLLMHGPNKDACLLPEKVDGYYWLIHRPMDTFLSKPSIWISASPDLIHWGQPQFLISPDEVPPYTAKIGAGPQPVKIGNRFLLNFHAVSPSHRYVLSLAWLQFANGKWQATTMSQPVLEPELEWECSGFFPDVVFCNGWVFDESQHKFTLYYGASDKYIGGFSATLTELLTLATQNKLTPLALRP